MQQNGPILKEAHQLSVDDLKQIRGQLDQRSHAHCLAKWYQVTLNLHNGRSASCCLQPSKAINAAALTRNPHTLHNSPEHIAEREKMRAGEKVAACSVCWDSEERGNFSERHFKSGDSWAWPKLEEADGDANNVKPTYIEVSFSHQCQLRCSYCNPETSSSIASEIEKYGAYPDRITNMGRADRVRKQTIPWSEQFVDKDNPYIAAFWNWLPDIYDGLSVFRLTGGEPFLSEDTFRFIDYVRDHPNPKMDLQFNSNLSFPAQVFERVTTQLKEVPETNYRKLTFYASLDAWGERAEYIRFGLRLSVMMENIDRLLHEFPKLDIRFTSTVSLLATYGFKEMLQQILVLKEKWGAQRVTITAYPLVFPTFQSVRLGGEEVLSVFNEALAFAVANNEYFATREVELIANIVSSIKRPFEKDERRRHLADFYRFFNSYDARKHTSFLKTFPEYKSLWSDAQTSAKHEKNVWLDQVLSKDSKKAYFAASELMRIDCHELEYQEKLLERLITSDPLTLELLLTPKRLHLKLDEHLIQGLNSSARAADVVELLIKRDSSGEHLKKLLLSLMANAQGECPNLDIWKKSAFAHGLASNTWNTIVAALIVKAHEYKSYSLCEKLLLSLSKSSSLSTLPVPWNGYGKLLLKLDSNEEVWSAVFADRYLLELPQRLIDENVANEEMLRAAISLITKNNISDILLNVLEKNISTLDKSYIEEWFLATSPETFYNCALVAKCLNFESLLQESLLKRMKEISLGEMAGIFDQWRQVNFTLEASILIKMLDEVIEQEVPWQWLKNALKIVEHEKLFTLVDRKLVEFSYVTPTDEANNWAQVLKEIHSPKFNCISVFGLALNSKLQSLKFESWWNSLQHIRFNADVSYVVSLRPQGKARSGLNISSQVSNDALTQVVIELIASGVSPKEVQEISISSLNQKNRWVLYNFMQSYPEKVALLWGVELLLVENKSELKSALSSWLYENAYVDDSVVSFKLIDDVDLLKVYSSFSSLARLIEALRSQSSDVKFKALDFWLTRKVSIGANELVQWEELGVSFWGHIYAKKISAEWAEALGKCDPVFAFKFVSGLERPATCVALLETAWSKLLDGKEATLFEWGDWFSSMPEAAVILAKNCGHPNFGDYCFKLWRRHCPLSADIVFSKLWHLFSSSHQKHYLEESLVELVKELSEDELIGALTVADPARFEACFSFLQRKVLRPNVTLTFLQICWTQSSRRVDALYAAAKHEAFSLMATSKWAITQMAHALESNDQVSWNIVDLIIENKVDRALISKLSRTILSQEQQTSPPGMKLGLYGAGKINQVSDM